MKKVLLGLLLWAVSFLCNAQVELQVMTAYNHFENKHYEEAWKLSHELMSQYQLDADSEELASMILRQSVWPYAQELEQNGSRGCYEAIDVLRKTKEYCDEKHDSVITLNEALLWYKLASSLYLRNADSAYICLDSARVLFGKIESHKDVASCLATMASLKKNSGETEKALELYLDAERAAIQSKDTSVWIDVLNRWQNDLYDMGRTKERTAVLNKLLDLEHTCMGLLKGNKYYLTKGDDAKKIGDYQLAEYYYLKVLQRALKEEDLSMQLRGLDAMIYLRYEQKNYADAILYGKKRLVCSKRAGRPQSDFALTYLTVANSYAKCHDKENALLYCDSTSMYVKDDVDQMIRVLNGQCVCLSDIGMNDKALELISSADSLLVTKYGLDDARRCLVLRTKGNTLNRMGRYKDCAAAYRESEQLSLRLYGEQSSEHIVALDGLANILAIAGDIESGAKKYVEMVKILQRKAKEEMGGLSRSERETYWEDFSDKMRFMTSFGIKGEIQSEEFVNTACESLIFSQAFLLESDVSLQDLVDGQGSEVDKERLQVIKNCENQIKKLSKEYETNKDKIAELKKEMARNEQLLCASFEGYEDYVNFLNVTLDDIVEAMPSKSILIDYNDIKKETNHYHAAFVTKKSDGKTALKMVFDWNDVDALLDGAPLDVLYKDYLNDSARALLWDPLSQYVEDGCTIYYVPAGKMHQVSLESFTAPDGKLLSEHYKFVRLSSARELVRKNGKARKPAKARLYGGLKYDMSADSMLAESSKYDLSHLLAETRSDVRGDSLFGQLPNTLEEIDYIASILRTSGVCVTPYSGMQGTEESFLAMSGNSPDILHIATHGFYYTPNEAAAFGYLNGYNDAMMLSGLVMSGGNAAKRGETLAEGVMDGILSAGDIAKMKLRNTDLVVLSACQTGLGKVTSEGVYGLQRAFKLAGVKSIVMTLWNVDDQVTKQFMIQFYKKLVEFKWDRRRAFDAAREHIRGLYPESPYYWAGFVMID